jgi:RimJ/RimL family protein N-acetyltransferase
MKLEPQVLENPFVRLEPMGAAHREGLRAACDADPETWTKLYPYPMGGEHFDGGWRRLYAEPGPDRLNFAVLAGGEVVGVSSYLRIEPGQATVEIGGTYYRPEVRGGVVNPSAKRLLLDHAFASGARRVQFRVDAINARSRAAVLKLGAVQEGIMRADMQTWTGRIRDTVVFSILQGEWPAVREKLDERLSAVD